jgi:hypothetical protein
MMYKTFAYSQKKYMHFGGGTIKGKSDAKSLKKW